MKTVRFVYPLASLLATIILPLFRVRPQHPSEFPSNLQEIRARKGPIIAIATEGDTHIAKQVEGVIYVPAAAEPIFPLLGVIPLQLLAYHIAVERGCDVDKPRNLAKSVTVE